MVRQERRYLLHTTLLVILLLGAVGPVLATNPFPTVMNYQGRLTDNTPTQDPINTSLPMTFRIYPASVGGATVWVESWALVPVNDGIFSLLLGSITPMPALVFTDGTPRYLEIEVNGEILTPRQQFGTVGYAAQADIANDVECTGCILGNEIGDNSLTSADLAPGSVGSTEIADNIITASDIAVDTIGATEIATNGVGSLEIATDAVGSLEIAANAVGASEIAGSAVGSAEIATGAVGPLEIDPSASFVMDGLEVTSNMTVLGDTEFVGAIQENGCTDGTVEQRFPGLADSSAHREMIGCAGSATFLDRASMCAPGWHVCDRVEWQNNFGAMTPAYDYWVDDRLYYNGGGTNNCAVSTTSGSSCGSTTSMKVCAPAGGCVFEQCGYGTAATGFHYYYGGCGTTGGALCCKGDPPATVAQFADTSGDNIGDTWLDASWAGLAVGTNWYLFVETQIDGGPPAHYCLSDAKYYIDSYLANTPGSFLESDGGRTKYYRSNLLGSWVSTNEVRTNYWGNVCNSTSYGWCIAWSMGGIAMAISPNTTGWGEVVYSTTSRSTMRFRVAPTRLSACGF
jgi:hypothetical protein